MAVAINWFEVLLPSNTLLVPTRSLIVRPGEKPQTEDADVRTIQRRRNPANPNEVTVFVLIDTPPDDAVPQPMAADDEPSVVKAAIEIGFAAALRSHDCLVYLHHVGGSGYYATQLSAAPHVYTFYRGLQFRCFYGFGGHSHRWGLVLNYATSQRFRITLAERSLQQHAMGKRVVPVVGVLPVDDAGTEIRSGVLRQVSGGTGIIVRPRGDEEQINLNEWTLPCRKETLCDYLRLLTGDAAAVQARRQLDIHSHLLSERGFMNTSLAKDQMREVGEMLSKFSLSRFSLMLPSRPTVSLVDRFLTVGATA